MWTENAVFLLLPIGSALVKAGIPHVFVPQLLIKSRKMVVRGPYQTPCQFRASINWFTLTGSGLAKSGLFGIISASSNDNE